MSNSTPSPSSQEGAAQALLELAAAIEAGDPPDLLDLRHALGSFRAAGLDKRAQQHVIEAREDARAGRIPDPLLLRMVAKAVAAAPAAPPKAKSKYATPDAGEKYIAELAAREVGAPPKAKSKPTAAPAMVSVAERTVRPDGVGFTTVKLVPAVPPAEPESPIDVEAFAEIKLVSASFSASMVPPEPEEAMGEDEAVAELEARSELAEYHEDDENGDPLDAEDPPGGGYDREFFAARSTDADVSLLDRIGDRAVDLEESLAGLREQTDRITASLTDKEREVLRTHFSDGDRPVFAAMNGEGERPAVNLQSAGQLASDQTYKSIVSVLPTRTNSSNGGGNGNGHHHDEGPELPYDADYAEPHETESPSEIVARAADLIERNADMPANAGIVGALYELAEKLERRGFTDAPDGRPLLDRVEDEIARRIERAIASSADLPLWVIEWARMERDRKPEESIFFSEGELSKGDA